MYLLLWGIIFLKATVMALFILTKLDTRSFALKRSVRAPEARRHPFLPGNYFSFWPPMCMHFSRYIWAGRFLWRHSTRPRGDWQRKHIRDEKFIVAVMTAATCRDAKKNGLNVNFTLRKHLGLRVIYQFFLAAYAKQMCFYVDARERSYSPKTHRKDSDMSKWGYETATNMHILQDCIVFVNW